jgi:excisionase family DNA binding protein
MVDDSLSQSLITVSEAAQLLHAHDNTVRRWSDQGLIKAYRIGRRGDRRFSRQDINRFLAAFNAWSKGD